MEHIYKREREKERDRDIAYYMDKEYRLKRQGESRAKKNYREKEKKIYCMVNEC